MPSSSRLYIAPEGHDATHEGFRQCSQMRGRYIIKTSSYSKRTDSSSSPRMFGSNGGLGGTGEVIVPIRTPIEVHRLAGELRDRPRHRLVLGKLRVRQRLVVVGPGFVEVVYGGEVRVKEDVCELSQLAAGLELELAVLTQSPAAFPAFLVFVELRVADARFGLDVVPPLVLGALAARPDVLAGHRAGVAPDALVEVHHHRHLRLDAHQ